MQYRIDGDQMMIAADSFVNLQESPATFIPLDGELAQAILAEQSQQDRIDRKLDLILACLHQNPGMRDPNTRFVGQGQDSLTSTDRPKPAFKGLYDPR